MTLAFKGGWGPEPAGGYLVRQTAVVQGSGGGYVVSILARAGGSGTASFAAGTRAVTLAARWVHAHVPLPASGARAPCA